MPNASVSPSFEQSIPGTLRASAAFFVVYGAVVVLFATLSQIDAGWVDRADYPRAFLRLVGTVIIALGLIQRRSWGFWLGAVLGILWLATGTLASVALLVLAGEAVRSAVPQRQVAMMLLGISALAPAVVLLLLPRSRAAFRRGAV